jgi:hypothetical protein
MSRLPSHQGASHRSVHRQPCEDRKGVVGARPRVGPDLAKFRAVRAHFGRDVGGYCGLESRAAWRAGT